MRHGCPGYTGIRAAEDEVTRPAHGDQGRGIDNGDAGQGAGVCNIESLPRFSSIHTVPDPARRCEKTVDHGPTFVVIQKSKIRGIRARFAIELELNDTTVP